MNTTSSIIPVRRITALIVLLTLLSLRASAQGVGISESSITPDASAILELRYSSGTYKGFLLPRMSTVNRNTIAGGAPPAGLTLYNSTTNTLDLYNGGWVSLAPLVSPSFTTPNIGAATGTSLNVTGALTAQATTNQLVLGTTTTTTLSATAPSVSRVITFPDPGAPANVLYDVLNQTISGAKTFSALSTFNLGITATGAAINLNTAAGAFNTNINTGTSTGAINIGNAASTGITQQVGTGNFSLDGTTGSTYTIGASTTTGTMTIGGTAQTGTMTIGSSSAANTLAIANGSGATTLQLANVQNGGSISLGAGMTTGTITIGGTGAQTGTIGIGTGTGAQIVNLGTGGTGAKTINIGTGAVANPITIGGTGANTITIGNTQTGGAIDLGSAMTTGTIDIGGTSQTGTITLGSSSSANILAIANGSGATTLQLANVQNGGSVDIGAGMITGTITLGGTSQTGTITVGNSTASQTVSLANGANSGAQTVNIANGNTAGTMTVNILSGTGTAGAAALNLGDNPRVTTIDMGNITPTAARTITIGGQTSAVVDQINIGSGAATVAGGKTINIGTTTPTGAGSNIVTIGSYIAANRHGVRFGTSRVVKNYATAPTTGGAVALTAAQVLDAGIYVINASVTVTFPTAATLVAAMPNPQVGDVINFAIASSGNFTPTIAVGAGGTIGSQATGVARVTRYLSIRLTNVTGGAEAYTIY